MHAPASPHAAALSARIAARTATVCVIGLGYVGLPLARIFVERGFPVLGFDTDPGKVEALAAGRSYIHHIGGEVIGAMNATGRFAVTADPGRLGEADALLICVPTPLTRHREPDMTYVVATAETIAATLRPGQLVILESSTYPGTTAEVVKPILERGGLRSGTDIFLAYSPEREDPGNIDHSTSRIPKVVGAEGEEALSLSLALYDAVVPRTVPVSSAATAEAVKLTENIFRAVNIALVNELKQIYAPMGIDVWEVISAASTKPFGFMPFWPGPGLGGHCIPIDPFYLTWKAREHEVATRFIELAGEINTAMPRWVVQKLADALNDRAGKGLKAARILLLGAAYKKNVDDMRESPTLKIIELLEERGAAVDYHDPYVPEIRRSREYPHLAGRRSVPWNTASFALYDAAMVVTDHDGVDYAGLLAACPLVVDTRNACRRAGASGPNLVLA
ncbi:nucleotide sugar dehydrogenase [Elioraea rosea]|uniref:nucleotide sugar dehydrogenase n=1 Tax=Elioraea rosea TaxID=2492390 RepID=UPI00118276A5|nr:nucleotide sugar dehydrogenase [Elioraea rosea]